MFDSCKIFAVSSTFIPGNHFADIKGAPLSDVELKLLDKRDRTGITNDRNLFLSDDIAYTLNLGIEYRF